MNALALMCILPVPVGGHGLDALGPEGLQSVGPFGDSLTTDHAGDYYSTLMASFLNLVGLHSHNLGVARSIFLLLFYLSVWRRKVLDFLGHS